MWLGGGPGGLQNQQEAPPQTQSRLASPSASSRKAWPSPRHPFQLCSAMARSPLGLRVLMAQGAARRSLGNDRPPEAGRQGRTPVSVCCPALLRPWKCPPQGQVTVLERGSLLLSPFPELSPCPSSTRLSVAGLQRACPPQHEGCSASCPVPAPLSHTLAAGPHAGCSLSVPRSPPL